MQPELPSNVMGTLTLNAVVAGITRLRTKGGANPQSLYDLLNGFVTVSNTIQSRFGSSTYSTLPAGTIGLTPHLAKMHVFSAAPVVMTDPNFVCHTLLHPTDKTKLLTDIYFAEPFVGFLYVSAGFSDGKTFHFWLQDGTVWAATTAFTYGEIVVPTVANGYVYSPSNLITSPVWKANTTEAVNNIVQPSVYNGLTYKVTSTTGTPIMTSDVEPTWPTTVGATVVERRYITNTSPTVPSVPPGTPSPPPVTPGGSWFNRYGSGQRNA